MAPEVLGLLAEMGAIAVAEETKHAGYTATALVFAFTILTEEALIGRGAT